MDEEIEQRLRGLDDAVNDLARQQKSQQMQKEIELRLAKLNERDPNFYSGKEPPVRLLSLKKNTAEDILKQLMEEVRIDDKRTGEQVIADQELEQRLQELAKAQQELNISAKRKPNPKLKKFKQTGELIHQLMMIRERSLDLIDKDEDDQNFSDDEDSLEQRYELDWCSTCNENGAVRCLDCDNDIFCKECFRELHQDEDMRGHRTQPYQTKSS